MKNFAYHRPPNLDAAVEASAEDGADILAGGTTMVDLIKIGVRNPDALIDITGIAELDGYRVDADHLRFGALARMAEVAADQAVIDTCPALSEALWKAASPQLLHTNDCPLSAGTSTSEAEGDSH